MVGGLQADGRDQLIRQLGAVALLAALLALPSILAGLGWLHILVPLPVYCFFHLYEKRIAIRLLALGVGIAGASTLPVDAFPVFLFSLSLLPVGFLLFEGDRNGETLTYSAAKAVGALLIAWLLAGWLLGSFGGTDPYRELQTAIEQGFAATAKLYSESGKFSAEELKMIRAFVEQIGAVAIRLLPSILLSSAICTVWLNLVLGRRILAGKIGLPEHRADLKAWRLPDLLVWPVIVAGTALLISNQALRDAGLNLGLMMLTLYLTQGVAILASLFAKWSLPASVRIILYALLFFQMYGLVMVAVLGLADVWADFRKPRASNDGKDAAEY